MANKHITTRDIVHAVVINFIPVFLGILCGFGINRLYEKQRNKEFLTTCMQTIYNDNKQSFDALQFYSERSLVLQDTIKTYLHDTNVSVDDLYIKMGFAGNQFTFQSGYDILANSEHIARIDYTLLSEIKLLDRLYNALDIRYEHWNTTDSEISFNTDSVSKRKAWWHARGVNYRHSLIMVHIQTINRRILSEFSIDHPDKHIARNQKKNCAHGKPTFSSSSQIYLQDTLYPSLATDGVVSYKSRWSSEFSDPQWIMVNLEEIKTIGRIVLDWEVASAKSYCLKASTDSLTWQSIYETKDGQGQTEEIVVATEAKYLMLECYKRNLTYGYSLFEFEVYEE